MLNVGICRMQTNNLQIQGNYVTISIVKIVLEQYITVLIIMGENIGRLLLFTDHIPRSLTCKRLHCEACCCEAAESHEVAVKPSSEGFANGAE